MPGRPKHRARVAAALARGEPPPTPPRSRDPEAAAAREIERRRLKALTRSMSGFASVRCKRPRCKNWSVWGLDVCTRHGGLDPKKLDALRERLGHFVKYLDPNKLLVRAHQIIDADIGMIQDEAGKFLPVSEWPRSVFPAIASIKILNWNADPKDGKTECVVEVRFHDQARYHEMLMRNAGQLIDHLKVDGTLKHEHTVAQEFVDALREGLERQAKAQAARPPENVCPRCHGTGLVARVLHETGAGDDVIDVPPGGAGEGASATRPTAPPAYAGPALGALRSRRPH